MKVVLLQEVPALGIPGEVKEVKEGYARNFLLPQRLAVPATAEALKQTSALHKAELARRAKLNQEMSSVAKDLEATPLVMQARVGPGGKLYGSITSAEIATAVAERIGQEVDKRNVEMPQPLKDLGEHSVRVKLAPDLTATVKVLVQGPHGEGAPAAEKKPADTTEEASAGAP